MKGVSVESLLIKKYLCMVRSRCGGLRAHRKLSEQGSKLVGLTMVDKPDILSASALICCLALMRVVICPWERVL